MYARFRGYMYNNFRKHIYLLLLVLWCIPFQSFARANDGSRYAFNSVLAEGNWYKISITQGTGVYKLTYDDLKKIGLSNPANVKIYGYGGWVLDEDFSKSYVDDLPQVSIWMSNSPANFGQGDYILFYARGNIKWEYDSTTQLFRQTQNPYSNDAFYFVTESSEAPRLMETQASLSASNTVVTSFDDYFLHEQENVNIAKTGKKYYGEYFGTTKSRDFTLSVEGITPDPAVVEYDFIARVRLSVATLNASLNGTINAHYTELVTDKDYYVHAKTIQGKININNLKNGDILNLTYNEGTGKSTNQYLDFIRVNYKKALKPYGAVTLFRSKLLENNLTYQISEATNSLVVFDVTENMSAKLQDTQISGSTMTFSVSNADIREFALVDIAKNQDIPTPTLVGKVSNQNLHNLPAVDMVIIAQPELKSYAEELANLHKEDSGLTSYVIDPQEIYNEFSSGKPDATAYRRFMKMFYDRTISVGNGPKYLLLFGGGTYDNRLTRSAWTDEEKKSMLLTFQSEESLLETASYVTDDYFGFLDDNEGADLSKAQLDIGVGRLPIRTKSEASNIVQKIKNYMLDVNKGIWQNNITFVADDLIGSEDITTERRHIRDAENFSKTINEKYPNFIVNKIYEDAYERVVEANGARYPAATQALLDRINNGTLVVNFIGHGATRNWTHENLFTYSDIQSLNNNKHGLWITATCDFSRFDDDAQSAGELAIISQYGGAIGLFSTVRVVYISANTKMNESLNKYLLERKKGKPARLGDIMKDAKLDFSLSGDLNKLRFLLLGDPALRLKFPDETYQVQVNELNGFEVDGNSINIQALDNVTIRGSIVTSGGDVAGEFNGILESVVFDAKQDLKTRGNSKDGGTNNTPTEYSNYTNTLFSGRVEVKNGMFEINFTAPKDITYTGNKGKMSFLAYDNDGKNKALGSFDNYTVGGTNPSNPDESNPPVIERMYLNNILLEPDRNNIYVNTTPKFYAEISDDTGINLSSGIGHNIALIIDGNKEYDLTSTFMNEDGSTKRGTVTYNIPDLSLGNHYLEFRIWDVHNNSRISDPIDFVVTNDVTPTGYSFEIWGNPASSETRFIFATDFPSTDVKIKLSVYTLSGRMVWTHEERGNIDTLNRYTYTWDLNGDGGGRMLPGVYICTGEITINGKTSSVKSQKLIITSN
ncbi:MAG: type IX secretion system sortase PorU [Dysgonomonas sp.]|nr:type IX secretion system sortase PorU [Dysgonomonas sp.]